MRKTRVAAIAALISASLLLAVAQPAAAYEFIKFTGQTGDFGSQVTHADSDTNPGAKCGYSAPDGSGTAYLRWIKVWHFLAIARDISASRDSQPISSQVVLQRSVSGGAWKTVARSAVQKLTAYDDQSPNFSDRKLMVNATSANQTFRAVLTLKWWRSGSVEGVAKMRITYYGVKWAVGSPDFIYHDACDGAAD